MEETHRLREEIFDPSGFEVMYVWHIPEGEEGLAKLARERKRIAISVPELRKVCGTGPTGGMKVMKAIIHLLRICRAAGPAKVHLLGCTEGPLMNLPADSCDSTSWQAGRFGEGYMLYGGRLETASIYSPRWAIWRKWIEKEMAAEFDELYKTFDEPQRRIYYGNTAASAAAFLKYMEILDEHRLQPAQLRDRATICASR